MGEKKKKIDFLGLKNVAVLFDDWFGSRFNQNNILEHYLNYDLGRKIRDAGGDFSVKKSMEECYSSNSVLVMTCDYAINHGYGITSLIDTGWNIILIGDKNQKESWVGYEDDLIALFSEEDVKDKMNIIVAKIVQNCSF